MLGESRDHDVVDERQVAEDFRGLEHARHAGLIDLVGGKPEKRTAIEHDAPGFWHQPAYKCVEER